MTHELKTACEVVFQEHKLAAEPIHWTKDAFRGRLSFGMAALAKETLEKRNIICPRNPAKKTTTVLNPIAVGAASFEEAEEIILNGKPVMVVSKRDVLQNYVTHRITTLGDNEPKRIQKIRITSKSFSPQKKPWMMFLLYYIFLPICAALAGGLITYLLSLLV